jgi:hypothetical protein
VVAYCEGGQGSPRDVAPFDDDDDDDECLLLPLVTTTLHQTTKSVQSSGHQLRWCPCFSCLRPHEACEP